VLSPEQRQKLERLHDRLPGMMGEPGTGGMGMMGMGGMGMMRGRMDEGMGGQPQNPAPMAGVPQRLTQKDTQGTVTVSKNRGSDVWRVVSPQPAVNDTAQLGGQIVKDNPLLKLETFGQSIWMDFIRRGTLASGELQRWIEEDGLRGVTSNPAIFEKAIAGSHDYEEAIYALTLEGNGLGELYQALVVEDVQRAADLFHPIYKRTDGGDGFMSLEVSPHLAHDTVGTIAEARRLWGAVHRPNTMIKVPATQQGLPAIQQLIAEGINVNVTLLFGLPRYRQVAEAYLAGLEAQATQGKPLSHVASVASFFLSRIDVLVDPLLENMRQAGSPHAELAATLQGQVAIASAKVAYQIYREIFAGARFRQLAARGARPQRLLWASTSTKNPAYSDVHYVEPLIGPETINTMTPETLNAYRDHGNPAPCLTEGIAAARRVLQRLPEVGLDLEALTQQLEDEGVQKFIKPFDLLMRTLQAKQAAAFAKPGVRP
jgi:transaldolase